MDVNEEETITREQFAACVIYLCAVTNEPLNAAQEAEVREFVDKFFAVGEQQHVMD